MKKISNWGNYPKIEADVQTFLSIDKLRNILNENDSVITRGLGRCYGDSSLNKNIISTKKFNRITGFDEESGLLGCESGVSLKEILDVFVPRGWFLPTTPGTKYVTIGGAIASDVHGKNHHSAGSFCDHVASMDIMLADGAVKTCTREKNSELFLSSCGGMGLTGVILSASIKLQKIETAYIKNEIIAAKNLNHIMDIFEESGSWPFSVAWIDCLSTGENLGRSVMNRGDFALRDELKAPGLIDNPLVIKQKRKFNIPFYFPRFSLNKYSVKLFNNLNYSRSSKKKPVEIIDYESFFYPLDGILNWNRIYGKRGFMQYQFVIPKSDTRAGLNKILSKISDSGQGSFLAVLKLFGKQDSLISFPLEGYTLALDFPVKQNVFKLFNELDSLVLEYGGRLYLTKDARMTEEMFKKGYNNSEKFINLKYKFDNGGKFQSEQSKRIGI